MGDADKSKLKFLVDQLLLKSRNGLRMVLLMTKTAISLYLCSRNCYFALQDYLALSHPDTMKKYFGENTKAVFNKLSGKEKHCRILVGEIHIKPAMRYQGNSIFS